MFTSVLFDDINKDAFGRINSSSPVIDVLKDGYCFDQKATLKYSRSGCVSRLVYLVICRTYLLRERI